MLQALQQKLPKWQLWQYHMEAGREECKQGFLHAELLIKLPQLHRKLRYLRLLVNLLHFVSYFECTILRFWVTNQSNFSPDCHTHKYLFHKPDSYAFRYTPNLVFLPRIQGQVWHTLSIVQPRLLNILASSYYIPRSRPSPCMDTSKLRPNLQIVHTR